VHVSFGRDGPQSSSLKQNALKVIVNMWVKGDK